MKKKTFFLLFLGAFLVLDLAFIGWGFLRNELLKEPTAFIFSKDPKDSHFVYSFLKSGLNIVVIPAHWDTSTIFMMDARDQWNPIKIQNGKTQTIDGKSFMLVRSSQASVCINTETGNMAAVEASKDKVEKESGNIIIADPSGKICYNGKLKSIKGRGNWTWRRNKKPFNIKLGRKTEILNLDESDSFCLLSNYSDYSNIRNWLAYKSAEELGMPNPIKTHYVSLWIDGEYRGLYLLTEKAEVSEFGVNIKKQSEEQPTDLSGGYFFELSQTLENNEESPGFEIQGERYANIIYPKNPSKEQVRYIRKYVDDAVTALMEEDGLNRNTGKYYLDYFDISTFVKYYLLNEVLFNVDGGVGSFKLYKNSDSIDSHLMAGPAWDFDMSMGRSEKEIYPEDTGWIRWPEWSFPTHPETLLMSAKLQYKNRDIKFHGLLYELSKHDDFMREVKREYFGNFQPIAKRLLSEEFLDSLYSSLKDDIDIDNIKNRPSEEACMSDFSFTEMKAFMNRRQIFLSRIWGDSLLGYHKVSIDYGRRSPGYYRQMDLFVKDEDTLRLPLHARKQALQCIIDENGDNFLFDQPILSDKNLIFDWTEESVNTGYWIDVIRHNCLWIFQFLFLFIMLISMIYVYYKK